MGYTIPAGFARVNLEYSAQSSLGSNIVTGFGIDTDPGPAILAIIEEWWEETLTLRTSSTYVLQRIEARNDISVEEITINQPGTLSGDPAPPNTAALVSIGTGLVGRENRGRMYLPGVLLDGDIDASGQITTAARNSIQAVVEELGVRLAVAEVQIVILHSGVGTPTPSNSVQVSGTAATQRRRLRR